MNGFWAKTWRSPVRAGFAGLIISVVIASVLYGFNWHTFYDTRTNFAQNRAAQVAKDIETLAIATKASPGNDGPFRKAVARYSDSRRQLIDVSRVQKGEGKQVEWLDSNDVGVDETRVPVVSEFELEAGRAPDLSSSLYVSFRVGIRPPFRVALFRAWSLSALDYIESPQQWRDQFLYNRSIPLYGYLITILLVGFGTIRAFYRDQLELIRLDGEARELEVELEQMEKQHSEDVASFHYQVKQTTNQRDESIRNRDQLVEEIGGIEREYQDLVDVAGTFNEDDPRIQEAKNRKSQVERALASYNVKVTFYEHELEHTRSELDAAEQLLHEVEDRREDLSTKLRDRNQQIRKLQVAIQDTQNELRKRQSEQLRLGQAHLREVRDWEESQAFIEEQLGQWVENDGQARINFSRHSKVDWVEEQFEKIDRSFVDRYFTHVNNSEYERGRSRLIRVHTEGGEDDEITGGTILVALDDDGGRSFSMRYETAKDAPKPQYIGFALALLLRSKCRDFQNFPIRMR